MILSIIVWSIRDKWPASVRHSMGLYTLSEAMQTESYRLISDTLEESLNSDYILQSECKPSFHDLEIALEKEWKDIVSLLIQYGVDTNEIGGDGYTLLDKAINSNSLHMCGLLVNGVTDDLGLNDNNGSNSQALKQIHADINKKNKYGNTALDELCKNQNSEMLKGEWKKRVQFLIDRGADVTEQTIQILKGSNYSDMADWLLKISQQNDKAEQRTFTQENKKHIQRLERHGLADPEKWYQLISASQRYGDVETVQLLLEDFQVQEKLDEEQKEQLMIKAAEENTEVLKLYLKKDFPITSSVLAAAIRNKNFDNRRVTMLINKNNQDTIVPEWKDDQDYSLFMIAVHEGREETVADMYYNKVNIEYKNAQGLTALKIAQQYNFESIEELLKSGMNAS